MSKNMRLRTVLHIVDNNKTGRIEVQEDSTFSDRNQAKVDIDVNLENEAADYFSRFGDMGELDSMIETFANEIAEKIQSKTKEHIAFLQNRSKSLEYQKRNR